MQINKIRRYLRQGTLTQMGVFEAVARRGNYTRAAEELYMAQPTVSIQLKKLSETIGLPLLEQIGRQTYPTEAGRCLAVACHKIIKALEELEDQLNGLRTVQTGQLRIAASTAAKYFAPRLMAEFARRFPDVELALQIHNREALLTRLANNQDDLYIFANPPEGGDYVRQAILPNPLAVFARLDHPLAGVRDVPLERLAHEAFIMREPGSGTRMMVQRLLDEHGITPKVRMELSSNEAIKQAILAGLGVSMMSRQTLGLDTNQPQLTTLDIKGLATDGHWYLVYPSGKQLSPVAMAFLQLVRSEARKLVSDPVSAAH